MTIAALLLELLAQAEPFGPVPTPAPTQVPLPGEDAVSRRTLYVIAAAVLVVVVAVGYLIARDARRSLPRGEREDHDPVRPGPDTQETQRERRARDAKQRAKAKAARRARRANR